MECFSINNIIDEINISINMYMENFLEWVVEKAKEESSTVILAKKTIKWGEFT